MEKLGKGKHTRKPHIGKLNRRKISRDVSVTAKRHRDQGKTYMSQKSRELKPSKEVNSIIF